MPQSEADEAIAQANVDKPKSVQASLVIQQEGELYPHEALAYVVLKTVRLTATQEVPVVDALAASFQVLGATGAQRRQQKASTGKAGAKQV